jgi:type II secretory pathway pseudopilin PulG
MINKSKKNNKGFTLVETMFAVLILTFTIVGMMTVVANSLFAARYARDEITVNYLLQEAIDYIRNDRDTTIFLENGNTWDTFLAKYSNCSTSSGCTIDVLKDVPVNPQQCFNNNCQYLYYDKNATSGTFYNYDSSNGVKTNFQRKIVVTRNVANPDEIDITVTVDWYNGGLPVSRSLTTSLMKWQ